METAAVRMPASPGSRVSPTGGLLLCSDCYDYTAVGSAVDADTDAAFRIYPNGTPFDDYGGDDNRLSYDVDDDVLMSPGLSDSYQLALILLYSVTTALAVLGNLIVIAVLAVGRRSKNDLRAFLVNLAVADLTMAVFCMPFTFTTTMLHDWIFGATMCTAVVFLQVCKVVL